MGKLANTSFYLYSFISFYNDVTFNSKLLVSGFIRNLYNQKYDTNMIINIICDFYTHICNILIIDSDLRTIYHRFSFNKRHLLNPIKNEKNICALSHYIRQLYLKINYKLSEEEKKYKEVYKEDFIKYKKLLIKNMQKKYFDKDKNKIITVSFKSKETRKTLSGFSFIGCKFNNMYDYKEDDPLKEMKLKRDVLNCSMCGMDQKGKQDPKRFHLSKDYNGCIVSFIIIKQRKEISCYMVSCGEMIYIGNVGDLYSIFYMLSPEKERQFIDFNKTYSKDLISTDQLIDSDILGNLINSSFING